MCKDVNRCIFLEKILSFGGWSMLSMSFAGFPWGTGQDQGQNPPNSPGRTGKIALVWPAIRAHQAISGTMRW